jgi:hypothetical protein
MLLDVITALVLLALTVLMHTAGLLGVLRWVSRSGALASRQFWRVVWLLVRTAWCLLGIHLLEIALWAFFYWRRNCLPELASAVYFSGVTYTTVGYGDLVLPQEWQLLAPLEAMTGILMCGLSTGFFFALVSRVYGPSASRPQ